MHFGACFGQPRFSKYQTGLQHLCKSDGGKTYKKDAELSTSSHWTRHRGAMQLRALGEPIRVPISELRQGNARRKNDGRDPLTERGAGPGPGTALEPPWPLCEISELASVMVRLKYSCA